MNLMTTPDNLFPEYFERTKTKPKVEWRKVIEYISRSRFDRTEVFSDFVRLVACALACQTRETEYLQIARRYEREELEQFAQAMGDLVTEMEENPFTDVLGVYYCMEITSKWARDCRGEFYTPPAISKAMAAMLFDRDKVIEEGRALDCHEPACGSGGMILAVSEIMAPDHVDMLRWTAWDVSRTGCDMCYINTTLWGIPATIVWGNTLTLETHATYHNVHYFRVGQHLIDKWRNVWNTIESLSEKTPTFSDNSQLEFDFS